jgi:hypothetical protein
MATLVHITHEAREKMGGIGAVLEGLLPAPAYQAAVQRTVLLGNADLPLASPPPGLRDVLYETGGGPSRPLGARLLEAFEQAEAARGVRVFYGVRAVTCPLGVGRADCEVVLLDVRDARAEPVSALKRRLWEAFGLESDRFENDWGYEEWVRLAGPALEIALALLDDRLEGAALVSHEFMGLPTLLAARLFVPDLRTIYWAHECPPVRELMERRSQERLVLDEALRAPGARRSFEDLLKDLGGYKHALVSRAHHAHGVFAVSDRTAQELVLLAEEFRRPVIQVVYNGLPSRAADLATRLRSRDRLRRYLHDLLGTHPDHVLTHVARPVPSKSLDRDLLVLEHLDDRLSAAGRTAALVVLASDAGRRTPDQVRAMEAAYGWPVHHRVGWPDLVKGEVPIAEAAARHNAHARATRVLLINQFGFDRASCGDRVPEGLAFEDLRRGSDAEFGQSAYEPFGISPLETLPFGGLSVLSRVCGSAQLVRRVTGGRLPPNVLLGDYAAPRGARPGDLSPDDARRIEHQVAADVARQLADRLPTDEEAMARLLESGAALAGRISWQAVCARYIVPALGRCLGHPVRRRPDGSQDGGARKNSGIATPRRG